MKNLLLALVILGLAAAPAPAPAMISVTLVDSLEKMPGHLKITTSPAQDDLINVWVAITEPNPENSGVWASLRTRIDGKLLSRASLASHRKGKGFSVSFQMPKEAFEESSVMISVRGADLSDVGYEIQLAMFTP